MPHTLPGSVRARPKSHNFSCSPREIQLTTRAVARVRAGRPSNSTAAPTSTGRRTRAAQPCGFIRTTRHGSEKGCNGSTLLSVVEIAQGIRVPQRVFLSFMPDSIFVISEIAIDFLPSPDSKSNSCRFHRDSPSIMRNTPGTTCVFAEFYVPTLPSQLVEFAFRLGDANVDPMRFAMHPCC